MKSKLQILAVALGLIAASNLSAEFNVGVVDFAKCITESKLGKQEQEGFEKVRNQMQKAVEDLNSQLTETAKKLEDEELLDSLSPEAEKELKAKFQSLNEELNRYQSQYYQVMQQANMRVMHVIGEQVNKASDAVAKQKQLSLVINKEAAFQFNPGLEVTDLVIAEMNNEFDKNKQTAAK